VSPNRVERQSLSDRGFVFSVEHMKRTEAMVRGSRIFSHDNNSLITAAYIAILQNGKEEIFASLEDLANYENADSANIVSLRAEFECRPKRLVIWFQEDGTIHFQVFASRNERIELNGSLGQQLKSYNPNYSGFVKMIIVDKMFQRLATALAIVLSVCLVVLIVSYAYARAEGINVDPRVLPSNYLKQVESAIKSSNIQEKLDTILMSNFQGFTNVTDLYPHFLRGIRISIIGFILFSGMAWIVSYLRRLYPVAFFSVGAQIEKLSRIEKRREIWMVAIVLGFMVNLAAGIVIAFFG